MSQLLGEDGAPLLGFLDESAGEGAPAVLVIQEWWGVNEQVKGIVRRLASEGFLAFAVDLYRGKVTKDAAEAAEL
ncbi:MAG: dienelactone hydrolase family protein, partial [Myxococcaceae bacterium]